MQANWLRTTQLGSVFANRTKSAARLSETFFLSASRRMVQRADRFADATRPREAKASSRPPHKKIAQRASTAFTSS